MERNGFVTLLTQARHSGTSKGNDAKVRVRKIIETAYLKWSILRRMWSEQWLIVRGVSREVGKFQVSPKTVAHETLSSKIQNIVKKLLGASLLDASLCHISKTMEIWHSEASHTHIVEKSTIKRQIMNKVSSRLLSFYAEGSLRSFHH